MHADYAGRRLMLFDLPQTTGTLRLEWISTDGKVLQTEELLPGQEVTTLPSLAAGLYVVRIQGQSETGFARLWLP